MTIVRSNTFLSLVLTHYFQLAVTTHFTRQFMDCIYCIFPTYRILLVKRFIVVKYCNQFYPFR